MKTIVISGSFKKAAGEMKIFAEGLEKLGFKVIYPKAEDLNEGEFNKMSPETQRKLRKGLTIEYFNYIERADAVFIYNKDGYIGNSTTMEMAYAYALRKPVYALTKALEIEKDTLFDGYSISPEELARFL